MGNSLSSVFILNRHRALILCSNGRRCPIPVPEAGLDAGGRVVDAAIDLEVKHRRRSNRSRLYHLRDLVILCVQRGPGSPADKVDPEHDVEQAGERAWRPGRRIQPRRRARANMTSSQEPGTLDLLLANADTQESQ